MATFRFTLHGRVLFAMDRGRTCTFSACFFVGRFVGFLLWLQFLVELVFKKYLSRKEGLSVSLIMDDTELTYKFWRIRKTVMQVSDIPNI